MEKEPAKSPQKKLKSPVQDGSINPKTSVICSKVPDSLYESDAALKHFSKFGRVQKIKLYRKRQLIIVEFDQPKAVELAVLNAGAYDGFMFDVTRRIRMRRKSKRDDDPDWVPDPDIEEELSAMSGAPSYRISRQKSMDIDPQVKKRKAPIRVSKLTPVRKKINVPDNIKPIHTTPQPQPTTSIAPLLVEPLVVSVNLTTLSTAEAATELHQLSFKVSQTPDEQWRILDARDRILRSWGGAGSRVKVGGATIGTCPDMCPEKELLHRQAEHQLMTLETAVDSNGVLEPWRAVKQYSRSSADQEIPMCYELRSAPVLMKTCAYLLHEIADTKRQISLADWFHFMWDRFRGIRKDITQQALCCTESIRLVEMCARFHAHCAARLADLEHTQFDQRLNTDNLTKCLQTLKHMYADVGPEQKPNEAEFRGYIALLNLGDSNFLWEIKHLSQEVQKSEPIVFAIQVFIALDNNNYVRFFRLVRERATYLQACILLRYFNDVRARALARIVKGFAPRGGSRYPAEELMNTLAFESIESMKSFVNHYGLRLARTDTDEIAVILNRNLFIEDSDPYPIARAVALIETKRQSTVGEVIAGGQLPKYDFRNTVPHTSFSSDGKLKITALIAEDLGYNTKNDSNKDVQALKAEIQRFLSGGRNFVNERTPEHKRNIFLQSEQSRVSPMNEISIRKKVFSFQPAIPIAPKEIVNTTQEKTLGTDPKNLFTFSKPGESPEKEPANIFKSQDTIFGKAPNSKNVDPFNTANNLFKVTKPADDLFKKPPVGSSIFGQKSEINNSDKPQSNFSKNVFASTSSNLFSKKEETSESQNLFRTNIFSNTDNTRPNEKIQNQSEKNIFGKPTLSQENDAKSSNIFAFTKPTPFLEKPSLFQSNTATQQSVVTNGGNSFAQTSPGNLFKNALNTAEPETKPYSIFQSKNKPSTVASSIFNSVNTQNANKIYEFDQNSEEDSELRLRTLNEQNAKLEDEQRKIAEKIRKDEEEKLLQQRLEEKRKMEEKRKEEERIQKEREVKLEELRKKEEEARRQEQLKRKLEEERQAEMRRKAEEERRFKERVDKESEELTNELVKEIEIETVKELLEIERGNFKKLMLYAGETTESIFTEVCNEICQSEIKAEMFLSKKLMNKWFHIWKKNYIRNIKRRNILEGTPVWLTDKTPIEEARYLKRRVQNAALRNMNAIHRGYRFSGELKQVPSPEPFNVMEIIRSPLLKRLKEINYPYDKCFFWKVTVLFPGADTWLCRRVRIEKWLKDAFSDKKTHEEADSLIYVEKQSWNQLMDFAISISLINQENKSNYSEALEGSNSLLLYVTDLNITEAIDEILKQKYSYQKIPVAIITPIASSGLRYLELQLIKLKNNNNIPDYRIYMIDSKNSVESLNTNTKRALKWLARNYPSNPPIEIDHLKSVCQRFLGNEIWLKLRFEKDERMNNVLKDLNKLVECYNIAVERLTELITNEDLYNYPSFPLEFKKYLDSTSPYPKPYEFIPSNVKNTENAVGVKVIMNRLKLPSTASQFDPKGAMSMQEQVRKYCYQIGWFDNPERVVCKVVALLPDEYSQIDIPCPDFSRYLEQHDLIDLLNIIVYEKISGLGNFENRFVIYEKSALENYRNTHWIYETNVLKNVKHKALDYEDDLDLYIEAKRRKIALQSQECLMLEESDVTLVKENIEVANKNISQYNNCKEAVQQLEEQLEQERKKSNELENLLKAALCDDQVF